jgi:hypothetical protein
MVAMLLSYSVCARARACAYNTIYTQCSQVKCIRICQVILYNVTGFDVRVFKVQNR